MADWIDTRSDRAVQLEFLIGGIPVGNTERGVYDHLVSVNVEQGINTSWTATARLYDPTAEYLEKEILIPSMLNQTNRECVLTYGWVNGPKKTIYPNLVTYTPEFTETGAFYEIEMKQSFKGQADAISGSWPAGTRYSDIVQDIADAYNWSVVIEPSNESKEDIQISGDVSALNWIRESFCGPEPTYGCLTANGNKGPYRIFLEANGPSGPLHFHTEGYKSKGLEDFATYIWHKDQRGRVINFAPSDMSVFASFFGAKNVNVNHTNAKGEIKTIEITEDDQVLPSDATNVNMKNKDVSKTYNPQAVNRYKGSTKHNDQSTLDQVRAAYDFYNTLECQATLDVLGEPRHNIFDLIDVTVLYPSGDAHYLSGRFFIAGITDSIEEGSFTSSMVIQRPANIKGDKQVNRTTR